MISVIVPVYRVEKYIRLCVESILGQTYPDFELILVDDGSPDSCGAICDEYAAKDTRVRVIHKENGGLSDARNAGLDIARGEYITFVDSDDYIAPNMLELLLNKLERYGADISVCGYRMVFEDSSETDELPEEDKDFCMTGPEALKPLLEGAPHMPVASWGKLYRAELFADIRFPVGRLHEDTFTTYRLVYKCGKVVCSGLRLYFYLQRVDSIMGRPFNPKRLDALAAGREIIGFVKEKRLPLKVEADCYYIMLNLLTLDALIRDPSPRRNIRYIRKVQFNIISKIPSAFKSARFDRWYRTIIITAALGWRAYASRERIINFLVRVKHFFKPLK
jgi:glycosyltransferase involved in cell wall biosynthesis